MLPDDAISDKNYQKTNQGNVVLMNSTTNPAPEKDIHKDVEDSNNPYDKASNNKILQFMKKVIKTQMKYKIHQMIQTKI